MMKLKPSKKNQGLKWKRRKIKDLKWKHPKNIRCKMNYSLKSGFTIAALQFSSSIDHN